MHSCSGAGKGGQEEEEEEEGELRTDEGQTDELPVPAAAQQPPPPPLGGRGRGAPMTELLGDWHAAPQKKSVVDAPSAADSRTGVGGRGLAHVRTCARAGRGGGGAGQEGGAHVFRRVRIQCGAKAWVSVLKKPAMLGTLGGIALCLWPQLSNALFRDATVLRPLGLTVETFAVRLVPGYWGKTRAGCG